MNLHSINSTHLSLLEVGQFINRQLTDISALGGSEILTDEGLNYYLLELGNRQHEFSLALVQVRKNDETIKIEAQDRLRDQDYLLLKHRIELYKYSDDEDEQEAARSLSNLFKAYKNLAKLNYEAESIGLDELLNDLINSSKYAPMVELLAVGTYVTRLQERNNVFKTLFGGRSQEVAQQVTYDAKLLKKEMLKVYNDLAQYVLSMARLRTSTPLFQSVLNIINTNRKYYADLMARRNGVTAKAE